MVLKNLYKFRSINHLTVHIITFGDYVFFSRNQNMKIYLKKYRDVSNNFSPYLFLSSISFLLYNAITTLAVYPALHHLKRVDRLAYARTCTITSANRGIGPLVEWTFVALNTRRCRSRGAGLFRRFVPSRISSRTSGGSVLSPISTSERGAHIHRATHVAKFYAALAVRASRISADEQRQLRHSNSARSGYTWVPNALEVSLFNETHASAATSIRFVRRLYSLNNNSLAVRVLQSSICIGSKTTTTTTSVTSTTTSSSRAESSRGRQTMMLMNLWLPSVPIRKRQRLKGIRPMKYEDC